MIEETYLPMALQIGVDYELFWSLTPGKLDPFVKAYENTQKNSLEKINYSAWLNGIYVTYSIAAVMGENVEYPEKPLELISAEESEKQRQKRNSELFSAYAARMNEAYKKRSNI